MDDLSAQQAQAGSSQRAHEAASWFAHLLDEPVSQDDYAKFRAWLVADERNAQAYARIEQLWSQAALEPAPAENTNSRRNFLKHMSAIAVVLGAGAIAHEVITRPDYSTGTGEMRDVILDDGSRVKLGAASAISVDFSASRRHILLSRGEAYFTVAADRNRPFVVQAGKLTATALGTAYSVTIAPEQTSVAVAEHDVRIEAQGTTIDLSQGDAIDWQHGVFSQVAKGEAETRMSWRHRQLVFLNRPLGEVVAEVNRWREGHLMILDRRLAARRVTAILDVNDMANIDKTLVQGLPISLDSFSPWLTFVAQRK